MDQLVHHKGTGSPGPDDHLEAHQRLNECLRQQARGGRARAARVRLCALQLLLLTMMVMIC